MILGLSVPLQYHYTLRDLTHIERQFRSSRRTTIAPVKPQGTDYQVEGSDQMTSKEIQRKVIVPPMNSICISLDGNIPDSGEQGRANHQLRSR